MPTTLWNDLMGGLEHALDFGRYWLSHENVGPLGVSPHTERWSPLVASMPPQGFPSKEPRA